MNPDMASEIVFARKRYCETTDTDFFSPISIELAMWIAEFVLENKPKSACDLGSGFSSWLFRYLGIPKVDSYDANPYWARMTETFIGNGVKIGTFKDIGPDKYDLVLLDSSETGCGTDRAIMIRLASDMVADGGYLIIDDYNWKQTKATCKGHLEVRSLERETLDVTGRYAGITGPRPPRNGPQGANPAES